MDGLIVTLKGMPYFGESVAVITAMLWAIAVIFFKKSGESVHPIALNLFKNALAFVLIFFTMLALGVDMFPDVPTRSWVILLLAGGLGIGLADTFFFKSLNLLGASLSAVVSCLYSPSIITLSILILREKITVLQVIGTTLIVSAVVLTTNKKEIERLSRENLIAGILWGALSQVTMAFGVVISKNILDVQNLLWVSEVRFLGGFLVLVLLLVFHPRSKTIIKSLFEKKKWGYTLAGSFTGAYLALVFWLAGMKYARVSIAAVLNQTSEIFIFILAAIFLKEAITRERVTAVFLAFCGAVLVAISG